MSTSDAFLSHNSADKPQVEAIGRHLEARGVTCWLDKWHLIPGAEWQEEIEAELKRCVSCVVFVGAEGIRKESWQHEEMRRAIARRVEEKDQKFRVIPVLLPGADRGKRSELPDFLTRATWVEFAQTIDEPEALDRLVAGIRGVPPRSQGVAATFSGRGPYQGLDAFQKEDADLYFGREADVEWLLQHLKDARFLAIVGASGSGKSSLARAGLVPALEKGALPGSARWPVVLFRPGARPLESLATALGRHGLTASAGTLEDEMKTRDNRLHLDVRQGIDEEAHPDRRVVILVDQFEEVFTVCDDEVQRAGFIANLLYAAQVSGGRTVVVLTMRADFIPQCAAYGQLAVAMSDHQGLVGPMDRENLRQVIERPAALTGCELEPGLVEMLLDDMEKQPPGALPLLQHCLKQLWERREGGRRLTVAAYKGKEIGGIAGALEKHADRIFDDLGPKEQEACAALFTKLVRPGEGSADTKRIAALAKAAPDDASRQLIQLMSAPEARLLTTGADGVEITHEALIRSWGKLRQWVERDRKWILVEQRLGEDAETWKDGGRKAKFLYSGARLEDAKEWRRRKRKAREAQHFPLEMTFVGRSIGRANLRTRLMGTLTLLSVALTAAALWTLEQSLVSRDKGRETDGNLALFNATSQPQRYPEQILHRARAIGFAGYGGADPEQRVFLGPVYWREAWDLVRSREVDYPVLLPEEVEAVGAVIAEQLAYLPFWRSADSGAAIEAVEMTGTHLLARDAEGTVRRWDLAKPGAEPEVVPGLEVRQFQSANSVRFGERSVTLQAYGHDVELTGHPAQPTAWALSPGKDQLVVGMENGALLAWDLRRHPVGKDVDLTPYLRDGWVDFDARKQLFAAWKASGRTTDLRAFQPETPGQATDDFVNSLGMRMIRVEPGTFTMGDGRDAHPVTITQPFLLGQHEVTQTEWEIVMGENPSNFVDPLAPVESVSWEDCQEFIAKLNALEKLPTGWVYALPTEAQWEHACRAGTKGDYNVEGTKLDDLSWYDQNSGNRTHCVGRKLANAWGLHDMHGNVREWCSDWYAQYASGMQVDPQGPASGSNPVIRGGCWNDWAANCRSAIRRWDSPDYRDELLGFRLACSSTLEEADQKQAER